jgi:tyrosine-specific transport protein
MSKNNKLFGSILLISGTTIGAAMLALPITTGLAGFFPALAIMTLVWVLMIFTALYFLEVNVRFPGETNIISMVQKTLGGIGTAVAWIIYLLLLYALIAAYMVGTSQILSHCVTSCLSFELPRYFIPLSIFFIFSIFIYYGTRTADLCNRFAMFILLGAYVAMVIPGIPHVKMENFSHYDWNFLLPSLSVVATTFGYHIIIPTVVRYLEHDIKLLKRAIILGSTIPYVIYVIWLFVVIGIVPLEELSIAAMSGETPTLYLSQRVSPFVKYSATAFALFAIITSLVGVTLSLSDFLADGLRVKKNVRGKLFTILLTLLPPLFFALFYPQGFVMALRYAGVFVIILLAILPIIMALSQRFKSSKAAYYTVSGGKRMLIATMLFSIVLLFIEVWM